MIEDVDLSSLHLHLTVDGLVEAGRAPSDGCLWTLAAFPATDDRAVHSDVWECHPTGDEILTVLSGSLGVHVRDRADGPLAELVAGRAVVVPAGTWHRLTVAEPGILLSLTPRVGTRHER